MGPGKAFVTFLRSNFNLQVGVVAWPALTVYSIYYFLDVIDPGFFDQHYIFCLFMSLFVVGICLFATWFTLQLRFNFKGKRFSGDVWGYFIGFSIIIFIIGFPILVLYIQSEKKERLYKQEGVFVMAKVVDHRVLDLKAIRAPDFSSLTVGFHDEKKIYHKISLEVSSEHVKTLIRKREVPIVYVRSYPEIAMPLMSRKWIAYYSHKEIKNLALADLLKLSDSSALSNGRKTVILCGIDGFWRNNGGGNFSNAITGETLEFRKDGELEYYIPGLNKAFREELENLGFKEAGSNARGEYRNDSFIVVSKRRSLHERMEEVDINEMINSRVVIVRRRSYNK